MSGWVKLWRKSLDSGMLKNPELWTFWCWCLMKATHKPTKQMIGWQMVELDEGEFVFGRKAAAKELETSERKIRTCLKKLKNLQNLTIKATNKFSIITINNWHTYQQPEIKSDQQNDQHVTSRRPAGDHKQECKNIKNKNSLPENVLTFSQRFYEHLKKAYPEKKIDLSNGKVSKGANTVYQLIEIDGFDLDKDIRPALMWALKDDFWQAQVNSLAELRKKKSGAENHKFYNLYQRFKAESKDQRKVNLEW